MLVDIGRQLIFPPEVGGGDLRWEYQTWCSGPLQDLKTVYIIELIVPWGNTIEEACECKKLHYAELATEATQCGWNTKVCPVEVRCRGFVTPSTIRLLKERGIHSQPLWNTIRWVSEEAERSSRWFWLKRKDPCCAPNMSGWSSGTVWQTIHTEGWSSCSGLDCGWCIVWKAETPSNARIHYWGCVLCPIAPPGQWCDTVW